MFLTSLFSRNRHGDAAHRLYTAAVARAREPVFYASLGVPDTLEGRFEMISLHVYLVLRRLKRAETAAADALGQALFDLMFADMDRNLREMGAGDLGVGRRVKTMAQAFYGRVRAYDEGLGGGAASLSGALVRNVYAGVTPAADGVERLAAYAVAVAAALDAAHSDGLLQGEVDFGPLPEAAP